MLHGPWVAAMLNDYLPVEEPPAGFDLSAFTNIDNTTQYTGTRLESIIPNSWGTFTFANAGPLDPATSYDIEIDYEVTQGTIGRLYIYSSLGVTDAAADNSNWYWLYANEALAGSGTLSITIGPGLHDWDLAVSDNEPYMLFEVNKYNTVSAIRMPGVDGSGGGAPDPPILGVKALAVTSTHVSSVSTTYRSQIANEITGTGYTAGGVAVTGVVVAWDAVESRAYVTCDLVDFGAVTATDVAGIVFYADTGSAATDRVLWTDTFAPVAATGSLTYQPSPEGAMEIRV